MVEIKEDMWKLNILIIEILQHRQWVCSWRRGDNLEIQQHSWRGSTNIYKDKPKIILYSWHFRFTNGGLSSWTSIRTTTAMIIKDWNPGAYRMYIKHICIYNVYHVHMLNHSFCLWSIAVGQKLLQIAIIIICQILARYWDQATFVFNRVDKWVNGDIDGLWQPTLKCSWIWFWYGRFALHDVIFRCIYCILVIAKPIYPLSMAPALAV